MLFGELVGKKQILLAHFGVGLLHDFGGVEVNQVLVGNPATANDPLVNRTVNCFGCTRQCAGNLQLVGGEVHDGEGAVRDVLATISEVLAVLSVGAGSANGARLEQGLGQHVLITDDAGPLGKALQLDEVVVTRLGINVEDLGLAALLVQALALVGGSGGLAPGGRLGLGCSSGRGRSLGLARILDPQGALSRSISSRGILHLDIGVLGLGRLGPSRLFG